MGSAGVPEGVEVPHPGTQESGRDRHSIEMMALSSLQRLRFAQILGIYQSISDFFQGEI